MVNSHISNIDISKYPLISKNIVGRIAPVIQNWWYLKINFLEPEIYFEVEVSWDELRL